MDVVLGAAVTGPVARLALVDGSAADRRDVIDQSTIELGSDPVPKLAAAIVGTQRLLLEDGHRLAATRVCWSDDHGVHRLRKTLISAGIPDVTSVSESDAALALVRDASRESGARIASNGGPHDAALLFCDDDTATLSILRADDATTVVAVEPVAGADSVTACRALLGRLSEEPGAAQNLFLVSTSPNIAEVAKQIRAESPMPLVIPEDTDLALAHGATLAGGNAGVRDTATGAHDVRTEAALYGMGAEVTSLSPQIGPQLAYSMVDDSGSLPPLGTTGNYDASDIPSQSRMSPLSQADDDDEEDDTVAAGAVAVRPRYLLLGCGIAATIVVAFAALAVTVAVGLRPAARQVAMAQPQQHPMPTFLPLPTNVAQPPAAKPESVPTAVPQVAPDSGAGAAHLPGGSGPASGGPADVPPGAPPPIDAPAAPPPPEMPQLPSFNLPVIPMPPVIINLPPGGTPGGVTPSQGGPNRIDRGDPNRTDRQQVIPPPVSPPQPQQVIPPPVSPPQPQQVIPPPVVKPDPPVVQPDPPVVQQPQWVPPPVVHEPAPELPPVQAPAPQLPQWTPPAWLNPSHEQSPMAPLFPPRGGHR